MIYSLHGELIHTEPNLAVVECGGVGYACRTTMNTLKKIGSSGEVRLFTQLNVREDAIDLFGFADTAELQAFKQLTSISGVGQRRRCRYFRTSLHQSWRCALRPVTARRLPVHRESARRSPSASSWN